MEQKDLDRLFQEKLKDIEVTPHPRVWNAIEKKLQKKKRKVIPIWWFYGGTAAIFLLGSFLFFNSKNQQTKNNFPVITDEVIIKQKTQELNKENILETSNKQLIKKKKQQELNKNIKVTSIFEIKNKTIKNKEKGNNFLVSKKIIKKVINKSNELKNTATDKLKEGNFRGIIYSFNKSSSYKNPPLLNNALALIDSLYVDNGEQHISEEVTVKGLHSSDIIANKDSLTPKKNLKSKDFIAKEEDFFLSEESLDNKWGISPVVGILKSNSFSQVSALDSNLNSNNSSGENSLSYGIRLSYKLNKNWTLKSGIQIQNNSFTTNDVALSTSTNTIVSSLENVVVNSNNGNSNSSGDLPIIEDGLGLNSGGDLSDIREGDLLQNYGYIEIPLEVKYTLFSSKYIETSIITGLSSLILNENTIISQTNDTENTIGEASNLNTINFSGNFGLDLDIKLSDKINLNINPMFKTQLNTFSNNSNGFKPYTLGIYTGLKYMF